MGDMNFGSSSGRVDSSPVPEPAAPKPLPWYEVWLRVVTHPSGDSFRRILADPTARPARAFTWVAAVGAAFGLLRVVFSLARGVHLLRGVDLFGVGNLGLLTSPLGLAVTNIVMAVAGLALGAAILRGIAAQMRGVGNYRDLVYCLGAVLAPINFISGLLSLFTPLASSLSRVAGGSMALLSSCLVPLSLALVVYTVVLAVLAVETVEKFGRNKAMYTVLAPFAVVSMFALCWLVNYTLSMMSRMGP